MTQRRDEGETKQRRDEAEARRRGGKMKERAAWKAVRLSDGTAVDWLLASNELVEAVMEAQPVAELAPEWGLRGGLFSVGSFY